jgi:hypothetical protein
LFAPRTRNDFVPKADACLLHRRNDRKQVIHFKDEPIPSAWFWSTPIGHGSGSRTLGPTEPKGKVFLRDIGEGRPHLLVQLETQLLRIETNGTVNVIDQIPDFGHFVYLHVNNIGYLYEICGRLATSLIGQILTQLFLGLCKGSVGRQQYDARASKNRHFDIEFLWQQNQLALEGLS